MSDPKSPSSPFTKTLLDLGQVIEPDMQCIVLAVHPDVPDLGSIGAFNMLREDAIRLLREQADLLEQEVLAEAAAALGVVS